MGPNLLSSSLDSAAHRGFSDKDRVDYEQLARELSLGLQDQRRQTQRILANGQRMREVHGRRLYRLAGATTWEEWLWEHHDISKKQGDKYLRIADELSPEEVDGHELSLNCAYEVALADRRLRSLLMELGNEGLSAVALRRGRHAGAVRLAKLELSDEDGLDRILEHVEDVARRRADAEEFEKAAGSPERPPPVVSTELRSAAGSLRQLRGLLIQVLAERQSGQPVRGAIGEIEQELRALLELIAEVRARAQISDDPPAGGSGVGVYAAH